jgi:hypothetical protein
MLMILQTDTLVPQSSLLCPRCQTDSTVDVDEKAKKREFTRFDLNGHMKTPTHTREEQILHALEIDGCLQSCDCLPRV